MIYVIKYEDGPAFWNCREVQVEAFNESMALAKLKMLCPAAKITLVKPLGVEE